MLAEDGGERTWTGRRLSLLSVRNGRDFCRVCLLQIVTDLHA